MSLLGIDVGTAGCKAAAFSTRGECLASAYREYATDHPQPGWAELDSRAVLRLVWEVIAEVAAHTAGDPISALCVSSMGEAMTPVTRDRRIIGPSILSSDIRGGEYTDALAKRFGQAAFYAINPNILAPNYSMPKLCWLRDHQPELFQRTDYFLLWGDLVMFMLGCEPVTSFSHANRTLLFDLAAEQWSDILLDACGLPREKLPAPHAAGTVVGRVADAIAGQLGLPRGVQVVVGGHDQCCNALGAGIIEAGRAVCGLGTFACITPAYRRIPEASFMLAHGLNVEHHVLPGLYVSFIYNQGGVLVRWFRDTFARGESGEDLFDRLLAETPEEPTRLFTLPYFEMTGPPRFLPDPAGAIVGLKTSTTRGEILKSILEGITFYFVDSLRALTTIGLDTTAYTATGGGAKSDAWLQVLADILGVPVTRPRITEAGTLGAALLAGIGTGVYANAEEAIAHCVHSERTFTDPLRHEHYQQRLDEYQRLVEVLVTDRR